MDRTLAMGIVAAIGIAGLASADPFPGYADGYTNIQSSQSPGHSATLGSIYGGNWSAVVGDGRSFTNGTLTATRMLDAVDGTGAAGSNFMLDGSNAGLAGVTDQIWQDGFVAATARARYAVLDQEFGYRYSDDGGTNDEWLFSADESGIDPAGAAAVTGPLPQADGGEFKWLRGGSPFVWSSSAAENGLDDQGNQVDHMVTYVLTSTDGSLNEGRPVYLLFFEDLPHGSADWDYNDLVVEIAVLPLPAALGLGLAGLAGAGLARRRRSLA